MGGLNSVLTELDRQDMNAAIHWYQSNASYPSQREWSSRILCWLRWHTRKRPVAIFPHYLSFLNQDHANASRKLITVFESSLPRGRTFVFVAYIEAHVIVLLKGPKAEKWVVIDSNDPFGDLRQGAPGNYSKKYEWLTGALETETCPLLNVPAVGLQQVSLESGLSQRLSVRTEGACLLCALATTCFIALTVNDEEFCTTWYGVLSHCQTTAGVSSVWRFVLSTLRLMRTLVESRYSPVLLCTPDGKPDGSRLLSILQNRAQQHAQEKRWLENDKNCSPNDTYWVVCIDKYGGDDAFPVNLPVLETRNQEASQNVLQKFQNSDIICVLLYPEGETCPIGGQDNELLHFEKIATEKRATLQQEKEHLERVVQQTQHELETLRARSANAAKQSHENCKIAKLTEEITKLTGERDLLKESKVKLMQTYTDDRNELKADLDHMRKTIVPKMQTLLDDSQRMNEVQKDRNNKLTEERDGLKAQLDDVMRVNEAQKHQIARATTEIKEGHNQALEIQRHSNTLIADYKWILLESNRTIGQNNATIKALESNMKDFENLHVACNAELTSCQDKLKGQPDYQRKEFEHNAVMENINADLMGFRASFEDDKKVIAEYKHLNEQLTENLRKIITETDVLRKEMQTKHDTLHSEYTTLRTKHKNLQDIINDVYSATKNFRAPQNPRQPASSAQKRPFRRPRQNLRGPPL